MAAKRGKPSLTFGKLAIVQKANGPGPGLLTLTYGSVTQNPSGLGLPALPDRRPGLTCRMRSPSCSPRLWAARPESVMCLMKI